MPSIVDFNYSPCALALEDNPLNRVQFQSFPVEEGIIEGYNADYGKTSGRASEPFGRMWQGGDWNPINLNLEFRAGLSRLEAGPPGIAIARMIKKVNWLKAAAFPRTAVRPASSVKSDVGAAKKFGRSSFSSYGGQTADPPFILFVWGLFMTLRGRITAWTVNWRGPFEPMSGKPHGALVSLTFQPESGHYPNWYDIRDGSMPNSLLGLVT